MLIRTELDRSLVSGVAWTAVMRWVGQILSWVATFFAARLLSPADYGILAMAMIAIGLARMIEDFGLDAILVQDRSIGAGSLSELAGLIAAVGLALCVLFITLAHAIAGFFKEPRVAAAIVVLSALCLTDALQVVPRALLQRDQAFKRLAIAQFVQVTVTQVSLIVGAVLGLGYLALAVNSLAGAAAVTALLLFWRPVALKWPRSLVALSSPLKQGWRMIMTRVAYYGYAYADQTIIGRILGKEALGAYSFSSTLAGIPLQEIGPVVTRVVPGVFSAVQDHRAELRRYFLLLTEFIAYLAFPMSIGMALTADLFVPLLLGDQWGASIMPLRVLCLYSIFGAAQLLVSHVMLWTGQFRAQMWCTLVTAVAMPITFWLSVQNGPTAIAWMWVVVYPLTNIPALVIGFRTIEITFRGWLRALMPAAVGCTAMSVSVLALRLWWPAPKLLMPEMVATAALGAFVYASVVWLGYRSRVLTIVEVIWPGRFRPVREAT